MKPPYVYEVEFDVIGSRREEYERWLDQHCLEWVNQASVAAFETRYNEQGLSPEVKFVIEFDSLREWARFVNSDEHRRTTELITTVATDRDATLWERSGLPLDAGDRSDVNRSEQRLLDVGGDRNDDPVTFRHVDLRNGISSPLDDKP